MQVPDQFVPSVTQSPLGANPVSAPGVQAMHNAAPEQMEQSGAVVQKLGEETNNIGERIQNQLDDAMAKQAETGFLQNAMNVTNGDGKGRVGYLNTKGQDAINGYQDAATAIAKAKQDGLDGLANDFQKSMYSRVASQHLISFGREIADHRFQQTAQYSGEAAINRANTYATNASNAASSYGQIDADGNATGDFAKNLQVAEQETLNGVRVMKGAPAGSDVANGALLNVHTQIGTGALVQMMDARAPYGKVQSMYDDMKTKGMLDMRAMDTFGKMVKTYSEQESTRTAVSQNLSDAVRASQGQATSSTGTPDYQFPIKGATVTAQSYDPDQGGVQVNIPQGSSIQAPADGKVTQVGKDGDGNFAMKIQHSDGSVTSFSGLAASNVKVGAEVQRGEDVATSGTLDGGKNSSVLWSLTNADGQNVDPTKAGLAPVDLTKITDEKVLGNALDSMRKQVTDPYLQQQATSEMESMVRHNQQMANVAQTQVFKQASDAFYGSGMNWRKIPPSIFNQLSLERQQQFKDAQTEQVLKNYNQGQAFKEMGETDLVANFNANPGQLTQANVEAARSQLSNSTYLSLLGKATTLQNKPDQIRAVQMDNEELTSILALNQLPHLAQPQTVMNLADRDASQLQRIQLEMAVKSQIDLQQQNLKRDLNRQEKQKIMRDLIIDKVYTSGNSTSDLKPTSILTPDDQKVAHVWVGNRKVRLMDIPPQYSLGAMEDLRANGLPTTQANIAAWWLRKGRPTQ